MLAADARRGLVSRANLRELNPLQDDDFQQLTQIGCAEFL